MVQEFAVNIALQDLKVRGLIHAKDTDAVKMILDAVWVAGREYKKGIPALNGKRVIQYDRQGNKIGDFGSVAEACRELGLDRNAVERSIWYDRMTRRGHFWKYATDEDIS